MNGRNIRPFDQMAARAVSFELLPYERHGLRTVEIHGERRGFQDQVLVKKRSDAPEMWAVTYGEHSCLSKKEQDFIIEPSPSSRDDAYYADARFPSAVEAFEYGWDFLAKLGLNMSSPKAETGQAQISISP